ncbi:phage regulatory CII family protein [Cupriavidus basilensis]|uniref:Phage regulatory CII family protein n=1 Tax=Cupriavidus basilensis TaxID=68895 RepID=A0ABT6AWW7_9BURK|nr:phage regulatory CII family protein [Cupriavidus basilensis]MDF3837124.1 phage regulatory CII family protein [Cupriavidus basilensis]
MNIEDAAYRVAHDYPGGVPALAARMGVRSAAVLQNKLNPSQIQNHLTLREAFDITAMTGDPRIVDTFASVIGRITVKLPQIGDLSDQALLDQAGKMISGMGSAFSEFTKRYEDGEICLNDLIVLTAMGHDLIQCVMEWIKRIEAIHVASAVRRGDTEATADSKSIRRVV